MILTTLWKFYENKNTLFFMRTIFSYFHLQFVQYDLKYLFIFNIIMNDSNDNYKVIKIRLDKIITDNVYLKKINDVAFIVNHIVIHAYQFIKLYFIHLYESKIKLPFINEHFVHLVFNTVSVKEDNKGRPPNEDTQVILSKLKDFYDEHYLPTIEDKNTIPCSYKLQNNILNYEATDIVKNINNLISLTYFKKIRTFIHHAIVIKNPTKEQIKILGKELNIVFNDIINIHDADMTNLQSDVKYHDFIKSHKYRILPKKQKYYEDNVYYDIKQNPQDYLSHMINVCKGLERLSKTSTCKSYSPFPMRTNLKPKYFTLDTASVVNTLLTENLSYYKSNINKEQKEIWGHILKLHSKVIGIPENKDENTDENKNKNKNKHKDKDEVENENTDEVEDEEEFSYMIKTDGVACSLYFHTGVKKHRHQKGYKKHRKTKVEEEYLNDIKITDQIRKKNIVGIDVGKHNLLFCIDTKSTSVNKNCLRYTGKQRRHETKSTYFNRIINKKRSNNQIIRNIETKLSENTNKTSYFQTYKDNLMIRNKHLMTLLDFYKNERFRIYKWFTYINTQRSEAKFINKFKQKFGSPDKTIVAIGDWSQREQLPFMPPTKGIGFRKMFRKHKYDVKLIAEQYTSKKCHFCENSETEKFMKIQKGDKSFLLNGLLRCQNNECLAGREHRIIQRDLNGALNILEIALCIIRNEKRPEKYKK
jgi:hypothetical protein